MKNLNKKLEKAAGKIKSVFRNEPEIGIILGSGLGELIQEIENAQVIEFSQIPGFPLPSVEGHLGQVAFGELCGKKIMALAGRIHFYEGYSMREVVFPVRTMCRCGIKTLIVTNAGGAVNRDYKPGDVVLIKDHINLMGDNPLKGEADFVDMTRAYDFKLREKAAEKISKLGYDIKEGVYAAMSGPSYETPAEIKMMRKAGADIAGMSTVPEVIAGASYKVKILGLSMITNMAAGVSGSSLSHDEVIDTASRAKEKFKKIVKEIIKII